MIGSIIFLLLFVYCIIDRLFFPWHSIDNNKETFNIIGKNGYGENRKQRENRYKEELQYYAKEMFK